MRKWKKWFNAILSIILLLTLFTTYFMIFDYGEVTYYLVNLSSKTWFFYFLTTITIISGLIGLYILIRAIVSPTLKNYIVDKDEAGRILISQNALESNVKTTLGKYGKVRNSQVDVVVNESNSNEITANIQCGVYAGEELALLGSQIQRDVKDELEKFSGYPVKEVKVEFYDIKSDSDKRVV